MIISISFSDRIPSSCGSIDMLWQSVGEELAGGCYTASAGLVGRQAHTFEAVEGARDTARDVEVGVFAWLGSAPEELASEVGSGSCHSCQRFQKQEQGQAWSWLQVAHEWIREKQSQSVDGRNGEEDEESEVCVEEKEAKAGFACCFAFMLRLLACDGAHTSFLHKIAWYTSVSTACTHLVLSGRKLPIGLRRPLRLLCRRLRWRLSRWTWLLAWLSRCRRTIGIPPSSL